MNMQEKLVVWLSMMALICVMVPCMTWRWNVADEQVTAREALYRQQRVAEMQERMVMALERSTEMLRTAMEQRR